VRRAPPRSSAALESWRRPHQAGGPMPRQPAGSGWRVLQAHIGRTSLSDMSSWDGWHSPTFQEFPLLQRRGRICSRHCKRSCDPRSIIGAESAAVQTGERMQCTGRIVWVHGMMLEQLQVYGACCRTACAAPQPAVSAMKSPSWAAQFEAFFFPSRGANGSQVCTEKL
jgi:hypothetical protein